MYLGIIPARRGEERKGLWEVSGKTLVEWVISAANDSILGHIICSTDDEGVKDICRDRGVGIDHRPDFLAGDDVPILAVVKHVLKRRATRFEGIVLLQPTSPFIRPMDINSVVKALIDTRYSSAQTITTFSHNYHALNQRKVEDKTVSFVFEAERKFAYNKQRKPVYWRFGNVLATRTDAIFKDDNLFAPPSYPIKIPEPYAVDVDLKEDIPFAEWLIETGRVKI